MSNSEVRLPGSGSAFSFFNRVSDCPSPGQHCAVKLTSVVCSILSSCVLRTSVRGFLSSRQTTTLRRLGILGSVKLCGGDVVVFSENCCSRSVFHCYMRRKRLYIVELGRKVGLSGGYGNSVVSVLRKASGRNASSIPVHILRVPLSSNAGRCLTAGLFSPTIAGSVFQRLCFCE